VHQLGGVRDGAAKRLRDSLMPQTHAKQGFMSLRSPANGIDNDPGFCGGAGARGDEHAVVFFGELDNGVEFVFVVTDDGGFSAELLDVADEGEDEAVVVVDDKDAGHGTSLALMVDGDVQVKGAVLCEVGEDEFHEQVDYGEYQRDGDDDANPQGAGKVAENPCVHLAFPL